MQSTQQSQPSQANKLAELPNLNFGLNVKPLHCSIHPTIVPNILDHFLRRPTDQKSVVGTLLGSVDGTQVDISTCFSVPLAEEEDKGSKSLVIDTEYTNKMLRFHRKVNPKEGLIGLYLSGQKIDKMAISLFKYYQDLCKDKKNKALLPSPLIMLIDPTMQDNRLQIQVMSLVTSNFVPVFADCGFSFDLQNFEKTGLDVIFYNQDHYDTMAILQQREDVSQNEIGALMENQKLLANKDLMQKNFKEVTENLKEAEQYIQQVIDGEQPSDPELGRLLADCMSQFSTDDMTVLEQLIASNFEDAMMISSLSKLQLHQLRLSEKFNTIFAESITKSQPTSQVRQKKDSK